MTPPRAPVPPPVGRSPRARWRSRVSLGLALLIAISGPVQAYAQATRFAVVDLDPRPENEKLRAEVEREIARLRPGAEPIEDPVMRRLLLTGEGPADAANRAVAAMKRAAAGSDCETTVKRAHEAEPMILGALSLDEEREPLKALYAALVICEAKRGRTAELQVAAFRLRSLLSLPPSDFPAELWEKHVANATAGPATTELFIDSDPPNATVSVNFHGDGVTPRTMKVPAGVTFVELQKEGYKKAFRAVTVVPDRNARAVMRLVSRAQDRTELAEAQLRVLKQTAVKDATATLSRLSQHVRAETLVLLKAAGDKVTISFFDAERGAVTEAPIESRFDPTTGKVEALATRGKSSGASPTPAPATGTATTAPPAGPTASSPLPPAAPAPKSGDPALVPGSGGDLPEARAAKQNVEYVARKKKPGAPWWSWVIAGAVGAGFLTFMWTDQAPPPTTVKVRTSWPPAMP
ncbi:MAG TPA: PEGA domain-containing protein [Polyangia bacterium]